MRNLFFNLFFFFFFKFVLNPIIGLLHPSGCKSFFVCFRVKRQTRVGTASGSVAPIPTSIQVTVVIVCGWRERLEWVLIKSGEYDWSTKLLNQSWNIVYLCLFTYTYIMKTNKKQIWKLVVVCFHKTADDKCWNTRFENGFPVCCI